MSFSLPATIELPASPERHNLAIAEIVVFGTIIPIQIGVRYIQLRRHGGEKTAKRPLQCFWQAQLNFVVLFALIRIVGFALYLSAQNPSKGVVIAQVVLQSVGLSPLLLELSFILLRCGRVSSFDEASNTYPKVIEKSLRYIRLPVVLAVILIIVAGCILNLAFLKAGAAVLLATFVCIASITVFIEFRYRESLSRNIQLGFWAALATLPFYTVRVIYLMLVEFSNTKFDPVIGDWRFLVSLGFAMEVGIVVLLLLAGIFIEPLQGRKDSDRVTSMAKSSS